MSVLAKEFEVLHEVLKLSHHNFRRSYDYLKWCFKDVDFKDKTVSDIGGGNGIYSIYARSQGTSSALNLEPFGAGSKDSDSHKHVIPNSIKFDQRTIQEYNESQKVDIIILHDSINHLNEELFTKIHKDSKALEEYQKLVNKISDLLSERGVIIVTDCGQKNFWTMLGLKSPIAPNNEWNLHQSPKMAVNLFKVTGSKYTYSPRWSPFKRFDSFGRILSSLGFLPSFFMKSHFNLLLKKN